MKFQETVEYLVSQQMKKLEKTTRKLQLLWFIIQIIEIVIVIMGGIMLLWYYAPYTVITKWIITGITLIISTDIYKTFIYTKWILIKEE